MSGVAVPLRARCAFEPVLSARPVPGAPPILPPLGSASRTGSAVIASTLGTGSTGLAVIGTTLGAGRAVGALGPWSAREGPGAGRTIATLSPLGARGAGLAVVTAAGRTIRGAAAAPSALAIAVAALGPGRPGLAVGPLGFAAGRRGTVAKTFRAAAVRAVRAAIPVRARCARLAVKAFGISAADAGAVGTLGVA